ncbi:MAG: ASKHA domain-containing protein, partial [Limisphaerales bacterium]
LGVAIDLGTTTIVAQLVDLRTAHVLAVRTAFNPQAAHGADVMSRIEFALNENCALLTALIRIRIGDLIREVVKAGFAEKSAVMRVVIVGNSVMHHLFCGISVEPLAHDPFELNDDGLKTFSATELGWRGYDNSRIYFLPCLGSFVGSDILAGNVATQMHKSDALVALVDLGTNGEVVVGNKDRLLCTSTAAGPAFEGARISMGMRAVSGAISEVNVVGGALECHVLGHVTAKGICGSGLVDAVAAGLDLGYVQPSGRLNGKHLQIAPTVSLTQPDIRELQLAKGAIAAGIRLLVHHWGASMDDVSAVFLAGAFGNYINRTSAQRIGLLQFPTDKVRPVGNAALLGAKLALFTEADSGFAYCDIRNRIEHINLSSDVEFHEIYAAEMVFSTSVPS